MSIRLRNAAGWLKQARWRLLATTETASYVQKMHAGDCTIVLQYGPVVVAALERLASALQDPVAPDEEQDGE
jgi:hypothetical protein